MLAGGNRLIPSRLDGSGAAARDGQIGTGAGEGADHLQSQTGAATRDDDHFTVEI